MEQRCERSTNVGIIEGGILRLIQSLTQRVDVRFVETLREDRVEVEAVVFWCEIFGLGTAAGGVGWHSSRLQRGV